MTAFFVPGVGPEQAEARYVELAELVTAEVVRPSDRVRSVRFVRGAEQWTATVGENLSGQLAARTDRRYARRAAPTRRVSDSATVQAIFRAGDAHLVVTDAGPIGAVDDSTWDNPVSIAHRDTRQVDHFDD